SPYKPNLPLNSALGLLIGIFIGAALIAILEYRDRTFKLPGELAHSLQVCELGAIPAAQTDPGVRRTKLLRFGSAPVETVTKERSHSLMAESFRTALTSLFLSDVEGAGMAIAVTSAAPNEGKTTLVSNLGLAVAEIGKRVLLINGDLRQPRLHK